MEPQTLSTQKVIEYDIFYAVLANTTSCGASAMFPMLGGLSVCSRMPLTTVLAGTPDSRFCKCLLFWRPLKGL